MARPSCQASRAPSPATDQAWTEDVTALQGLHLGHRVTLDQELLRDGQAAPGRGLRATRGAPGPLAEAGLAEGSRTKRRMAQGEHETVAGQIR